MALQEEYNLVYTNYHSWDVLIWDEETISRQIFAHTSGLVQLSSAQSNITHLTNM